MSENNQTGFVQNALWIPVVMIGAIFAAITLGAAGTYSEVPNEPAEMVSLKPNLPVEALSSNDILLISFRRIEIVDGEWIKFWPEPGMKKKDYHLQHVPNFVEWRIIPL